MNPYLINALKNGRLQKGLKQSEVAGMIGVKGGTLSNYENGISEPDIDTFASLCEIYGLDYAYILGEAYGLNVQGSNFSIKPSEIDHIKKYRDLDNHGRETVNIILERETQRVAALKKAQEEKTHQSAQIIELEKTTRPKYFISYYQRMASAGSGEYLFDDIPTDLIEVLDTPTARRADFVIGVNGHSMEPDFQDGDKVFVEKAEEIPAGSVGVFLRGNDCFIKELGNDSLISHNSDKDRYPDIPASEDIRCVGLVLGKVKEN